MLYIAVINASPAETCCVEGCARPRRRRHLGRPYCGMHHRRVLKFGGPGPAEPFGIKASLEDRFVNHVQLHGPVPVHMPELGPCSVWTGTVRKDGYGTIGHNYKVLKVHRYAWERAYGPIPPGMQVDHRCFVRHCVRVDHLRLATCQQNNENHDGSARRDSSSGVRDVFPNGNHWKVLVRHDGKQRYFGTYHTIEEAEQVAITKRLELHSSMMWTAAPE